MPKKKRNTFAMGQFVFAKIRGYVPWPAKIIGVEKYFYRVMYYGDGNQTNRLKHSAIFDYAEYKGKFVKKSTLKNKKFAEGIEEIEHAIKTKYDNSSGDDSDSDDTEAQLKGLDTQTHLKEIETRDESLQEKNFDVQ
ncbi:hepatoma-derived growth factor-related protein 3-like [Teleopsis dalmanni]|uniref:hepatoma-derived growth factor-related protein 3-like n=1 Tax=Teleopsis dalmanni TaxID=139649 RepID=UPI0018CEF50C|nr:hepatoma-derived growth factor-related protein 3-like [Teleopsis dalmanni]XP_037943865.1 hepatoma-derived growth factor-related protein 3-like [Teleopsis dalmanni]